MTVLRVHTMDRIGRRLKSGDISDLQAGYFAKMTDMHMKKLEKLYYDTAFGVVCHSPIWHYWMSGIRGCGGRIAAGLICYIGDCTRFDTVSALWKFAGYDVVDGRARKTWRKGDNARCDVHLNRVCWLASKHLVMTSKKYYEIYLDYKTYVFNREIERGVKIWTDSGHTYDNAEGQFAGNAKTDWKDGDISRKTIHLMAQRYMIKQFLAHYWEVSHILAKKKYKKNEYIKYPNPWDYLDNPTQSDKPEPSL